MSILLELCLAFVSQPLFNFFGFGCCADVYFVCVRQVKRKQMKERRGKQPHSAAVLETQKHPQNKYVKAHGHGVLVKQSNQSTKIRRNISHETTWQSIRMVGMRANRRSTRFDYRKGNNPD